MTAQQDLVYGRQGGRWATKPQTHSKAQKVNVPAIGAPFGPVTLQIPSWGAAPDLPEQIPFENGWFELAEDEVGQPVYEWKDAT